MVYKKALIFRQIEGFSLIEVLVFVTVLSLFFVSAIVVTTFSLKNMKSQEHKIIAAHLGEEGMEWIRSEKEADWTVFASRGNTAGKTYCVDGDLDWLTGNACAVSDYSLGQPPKFKREVYLKNSGSPVNQVDVIVTISWKDASEVVSIPITAIYTTREQ